MNKTSVDKLKHNCNSVIPIYVPSVIKPHYIKFLLKNKNLCPNQVAFRSLKTSLSQLSIVTLMLRAKIYPKLKNNIRIRPTDLFKFHNNVHRISAIGTFPVYLLLHLQRHLWSTSRNFSQLWTSFSIFRFPVQNEQNKKSTAETPFIRSKLTNKTIKLN